MVLQWSKDQININMHHILRASTPIFGSSLHLHLHVRILQNFDHVNGAKINSAQKVRNIVFVGL